MSKYRVKYDREWGWKFATNLEVHGLTFALERALRAGATRREVELKLREVRRG